ncbi:hypothetical protein RN22_09910 [Grimontia sp. AD028]|uniref:hypothetical protein n=1 Tax=Grimontia sp. AD028 TaxID=1581149 RepID=UPI00061AFB44|nr:hypothetical protein [Grimontia sp. AD028]KKD60610.1 hypothetical protein RN22_09910 [Grimontia sp. AD028]
MNGFIKLAGSIVLVSVLGGCSHAIQISPPIENITSVNVENKIDKSVAYHISSEDRVKSVTTPGGGGDDVTYKPYADTEVALNAMLSRVFSKVYSLEDGDNKAFIADKNISYVFSTQVKTDSSSDSAFTWPPTDFTYELTCSAVDSSGANVWSKTVTSQGKAEFDEFKHDFSLSARRATEDAYKKMLQEIAAAPEFRK